ncbi:MAG: hypothetical protein GX780_03735 [Campylobacteraceae bacterium]|nr:hypothetical protein [Campylobacteraceae bacterium]
MGFLLSFFLILNADAKIYEQNCVPCHEELDVGIDKFFYRYVLVFSSEISVKAALKDYLLHPMKEKSILPDGLIEKYGIKEPSSLKEDALEEAIDEYWRRYTFIGKLR